MSSRKDIARITLEVHPSVAERLEGVRRLGKHATKTEAAREALRFYEWAERTQSYAICDRCRACRAAFVDDAARLERAGALLSNGAPSPCEMVLNRTACASRAAAESASTGMSATRVTGAASLVNRIVLTASTAMRSSKIAPKKNNVFFNHPRLGRRLLACMRDSL